MDPTTLESPSIDVRILTKKQRIKTREKKKEREREVT